MSASSSAPDKMVRSWRTCCPPKLLCARKGRSKPTIGTLSPLSTVFSSCRFSQAEMRAKRKASQEAKAEQKQMLSGASAVSKAGKQRRLALSKEASSRRFDDEDVEREVRQAQESARSGTWSLSGPAPLTKAPEGVTVTHYKNAEAVKAVRDYENVIFREHVHGNGASRAHSDSATDEQLAGIVLPKGQKMQPLWNAALHVEHWTQVQMAAVDKAGRKGQPYCLVMRDARGCSCAVLLATRTQHGCDINLVHTRLAWRRRQYAEELWRQLCAAMPGTTFVLGLPCCQAGTAGRFWRRQQFIESPDVQRLQKRQARNAPHSIEPGDYHLSFTTPAE
jgi:hypothetical protein